MAKSAIVFFSILAFHTLTVFAHGQGSGLPGFQETERPSPSAIQDPAEHNAYMGALNTQAPAQKAALLEVFVRTYPQSVVKIDALDAMMTAYQQAGKSEKLEPVADKILAINHDHLHALLIAADAKRSRAKSLGDAAQRLALAQAARTLAERGLKLLAQADLGRGVSSEESDKLKKQMAAIFNSVAGFGALQNKEFSQARQYYLKADLTDVESVFQLSYTELEMEPVDVTGFWYVVRAAQMARRQNKADIAGQIEAYGKAKYWHYHGGLDGWDQLLHRFQFTEHPQNPPGGFSVSRYQPPSPQRARPTPPSINPGNAGFDRAPDRGLRPNSSPCNPSTAARQRVERSTSGGIPASTTSFGSDGQSHGVPASVTSVGTDCMAKGVPASIASTLEGAPYGVPASVTSPFGGKFHGVAAGIASSVDVKTNGVPASIASPVGGTSHGVPALVTSIGVDGSLHGIPAGVVSPTSTLPVLRVAFGDPHARGVAVVPIFGQHPGVHPVTAALKHQAVESKPR
ncbi:MAG TPA: hypothetical protein VNW97_11315 [Candidatus Saccharimonadales bacterium]|jgi:hypothetical protein|nr:hypothetical protein [Candidatus Saccharimonadales bacterium]